MHHPAHSACAIFSTYDIYFVKNGAIDALKRSVSHTRYWEHDIWLIPIHNPNHWTLAIVVLSTQTIYQFDSQASQKTWESDVAVSDAILYHLHHAKL